MNASTLHTDSPTRSDHQNLPSIYTSNEDFENVFAIADSHQSLESISDNTKNGRSLDMVAPGEDSQSSFWNEYEEYLMLSHNTNSPSGNGPTVVHSQAMIADRETVQDLSHLSAKIPPPLA